MAILLTLLLFAVLALTYCASKLYEITREWYAFWLRAHREELSKANQDDTKKMWDSVREKIGTEKHEN